jgi:hypothetical protein
MRKLLLITALALSACAKSEGGGTGSGSAADVKIPDITVDQLDADVQAKAATPVDCNGERTRKKMGVVPGAIIISDEDTFAAAELPADKAAKLVFYCANPG